MHKYKESMWMWRLIFVVWKFSSEKILDSIHCKLLGNKNAINKTLLFMINAEKSLKTTIWNV